MSHLGVFVEDFNKLDFGGFKKRLSRLISNKIFQLFFQRTKEFVVPERATLPRVNFTTTEDMWCSANGLVINITSCLGGQYAKRCRLELEYIV